MAPIAFAVKQSDHFDAFRVQATTSARALERDALSQFLVFT